MSEELISRLQEEADLCRNEGADDIARLLDEAANALKSNEPPAFWVSEDALDAREMGTLWSTFIANARHDEKHYKLTVPLYIRPATVQVPEGWKLVPSRCPLCEYQHGHQIGCENNPVDIALRAAAPSAPVAREETALEQFKKFASTEPMTALERLRFFLSCALKPQDWLDVEQFLDALPSSPAAPAVDAERFMALVKQYAIAYHYRATGLHAHGMDEAHAAVESAIRALLTPAIANQEAQDGR